MGALSMRRVMGMAGVVAGVVGGLAAGAMGQQGKIVQRVDPREWTLQAIVSVRARTDFSPSTGMPNRESFDFTSAAVVFPLITGTASSASPQGTGILSLNDRQTDATPVMLQGEYPAGTRLGKWTLKDWKGEEIQLQVTIPATCFNTKFDEAAAAQLDWPKGEWPQEAASTFQPQLFVDLMPAGLTRDGKPSSDMEPVKDLLKRWTNGQDPKTIKPTELAKYLCGRVLEHVQTSGNGLNYARTGEVEGIDLQGAAETARRGRGSEFDAVCLLAAVYRMSGLPARTVIGWDVGPKADKKFLDKKGSEGLRAWVEFALADPQAPGGIVWVPVDMIRMRKSSSRMPPLNKPWRYFGEHDELERVIPFAFQFHPPTTVVAHGSPAFWGWMVTPKPPDKAEQAIRFMAQTTPRTAEGEAEKRRKREEEKKEKKKNPYGG